MLLNFYCFKLCRSLIRRNYLFPFIEVQTYYFNINITLELGCDDSDGVNKKMCYIYQPIRALKQYNNNNTRYYTYIRDRIVLTGVRFFFILDFRYIKYTCITYNCGINNKLSVYFEIYDNVFVTRTKDLGHTVYTLPTAFSSERLQAFLLVPYAVYEYMACWYVFVYSWYLVLSDDVSLLTLTLILWPLIAPLGPWCYTSGSCFCLKTNFSIRGISGHTLITYTCFEINRIFNDAKT